METFAALLNLKVVVPFSKTNYIAVDNDFWRSLVAMRLRDVAVDEAYYLRRYPDIAHAVRKGVIDSATTHYVTMGFFEHRMPYEILIDEPWYLAEYPDVADAVRKRVFPSAQDHFEENGYREGRHPYANFALQRQAGVVVNA